ncbi:MAG: Gfo/Idh/MocA family oxidoreductase [Planctomycetota bacterium]|nr:MAG: Gfo/Idh/MocA family oxidoreductase [Planctomycetota bacterium]
MHAMSLTNVETGTAISQGGHGRPLRCAVVGVGRMGSHHARLYSELDGAELIGVVDTDPARCETARQRWGTRVFDSVEALVEARPEAVTIATPTAWHRAVAEPLLEAKIACLIEKPLAPNLEEARAIAEAAERSGVALQVGHVVRYDPVTLAIRSLEGFAPLFIEVDRVSPMTFRSVDVGVVLDMMIHDIDVLLMLMGVEPEQIQANAVSVFGEAEDVCNARLTFPSEGDGVRCVANITASRLALKTERKIRLISKDTYVSADFVAGGGTVVRKTANAEQIAEVRQRLSAGEDLSHIDYLGLVNVEMLEVGDAEPLKLQLEDFLDSVRNKRRSSVDVHAGFAAVRTANRIVNAAREAGSRMV